LLSSAYVLVSFFFLFGICSVYVSFLSWERMLCNRASAAIVQSNQRGKSDLQAVALI
jgi:hypothetical protein